MRVETVNRQDRLRFYAVSGLTQRLRCRRYVQLWRAPARPRRMIATLLRAKPQHAKVIARSAAVRRAHRPGV